MNIKSIAVLSLLQAFSFSSVYAYITSGYGKECPNECAEVIDYCLELNGFTGGSFTPYPPRDAYGKCFCKDPNAYLTCLNCYQTKKNKKAYTLAEVVKQCEICNGAGGATTTAAGVGTATKTPVAGGVGAGAAASGTVGAGAAATSASNNNAKSVNTSASQTAGSSSTQTTVDNESKNDSKSGGGGSMGIIIIGAVAAIGVVGYIFYTRKQKDRPESMPFFGNSAASPNQYATLNTPKDMTESQNNLTSDYNNQFFSNVGTVDNNGYYQNNTNYSYDQNQNPDYNNQYDPNYQYNNQYPATTYENEIAGAGAAVAGVPTTQANYESRRESMMPNSQPTTTNVTGMYVVAYKYEPQLDDELELQVNDQVQIIEEYEDGWMKATNLTTGKEGMAPRVCIKEA